MVSCSPIYAIWACFSTLANQTNPFVMQSVSAFRLSLLNSNSAEPDQTLRSAASDLGLHCFEVQSVW